MLENNVFSDFGWNIQPPPPMFDPIDLDVSLSQVGLSVVASELCIGFVDDYFHQLNTLSNLRRLMN